MEPPWSPTRLQARQVSDRQVRLNPHAHVPGLLPPHLKLSVRPWSGHPQGRRIELKQTRSTWCQARAEQADLSRCCITHVSRAWSLARKEAYCPNNTPPQKTLTVSTSTHPTRPCCHPLMEKSTQPLLNVQRQPLI